MWSTVRLTKWPSTIGIRFVITLHSLHGGVAPGTRRPHHDSELISCYHHAFRTWGHYHNNIVLFYHNSPITRSHFMDPTDRAIKGFYCNNNITKYHPANHKIPVYSNKWGNSICEHCSGKLCGSFLCTLLLQRHVAVGCVWCSWWQFSTFQCRIASLWIVWLCGYWISWYGSNWSKDKPM